MGAMARIIKSRPASPDHTYNLGPNWWLIGGGAVLAWWFLRGRSAGAGAAPPAPPPATPGTTRRPSSTPTRTTATGRLPEFVSFNSEPTWVQTGTPLVQRLYRDQGIALNFYLQAMLYSGGFSDLVPDGTWSGAWSAAYADAASLVTTIGPSAPGSTAETVGVVSIAPYYNTSRLRLVPLTLPQPLIDAINAQAHRLYAGAMPMQIRAS